MKYRDVPDEEPIYDTVIEHCAFVARRLDEPPPLVPRSAQFIYDNAQAFLAVVGPGANHRKQLRRFAVVQMLDLLVENWTVLAQGGTSGEKLLAGRDSLWCRFMFDWPLGAYGRLAALTARESGGTNGNVLEVGAGVGHASVYIAPHVTGHFIRTDLGPDLALELSTGEYASYDINRPGCWSELDTIVASNVLHCAVSKSDTLRYLCAMLRPGGRLIMAEGEPTTMDGLPWALHYLCGMFSGWWDEGGFLERARWLQLLEQAGLEPVEVRRLRSGDHDLGGVLLAERSSR